MAVFKVARFAVRPARRDDAERALHEFAAEIRKDPDSMWTTYRDTSAPSQYIAFLRAASKAVDVFPPALSPFVVGAPEVIDYELVTSSDLAARHRAPRTTTKGTRGRTR